MEREINFFHAGGPCHIEISPLICAANQWTKFYMIGTSVMKELIEYLIFVHRWHHINETISLFVFLVLFGFQEFDFNIITSLSLCGN